MMRLFLLIGLLVSSLSGFAAIDVRDFRNPADEARYRALIDELRCPKCQNTNLAGSDAGLADDLKTRVYEQIQAGKSDSEIRDYLVVRYGDFISYKPPLRASTLLLWWGPGLLLVGVAFGLWRRSLRKPARVKPLDADEQASLQRLLTGVADSPAQALKSKASDQPSSDSGSRS